MPTPPRTSLDEIVRAGLAILDRDGIDALTMQRVAAAVGVRAPSLYKHVRDRDAMVRLIAEAVVVDLGATLTCTRKSGDPRADLASIALAFRAWAHRHPGGFSLLFARVPDAWRVTPEASAASLDAMFGAVAALARPDQVLNAARAVVAWSSGFVSMELAGAFRLGGDVDEAFRYGIERLAEAIGEADDA